MGRMFYTDQGRALRHHHEELSHWRWARKTFQLPAAALHAPADLWLYLWPYDNAKSAVEIWVNGRRLTSLQLSAAAPDLWQWCRVPLPKLTSTKLDVQLRSAAPAMTACALGLDPTVPPRTSALSRDQGKTWHNDSMGAHHALRGEYMIRLRSHAPGLKPSAPPTIRYDDPAHPRLRALKAALPASIRRLERSWKQVLALRTWVASQWTHCPTGDTYAPWDPLTILAWMQRPTCHGSTGRIAMCVHFGAVLCAFATALGHRARCVGMSRAIDSFDGHFVTEIFDDKLVKWVVHDGNYDTHFTDGQPLAAVEVAQRAHAGINTMPFLQRGPALPTLPRLVDALEKSFGPGHSYRLMGLWTRGDFVSNPAAAPPNHGSLTYAETDWAWFTPPGHDLAPMFPHNIPTADYFLRPPRT